MTDFKLGSLVMEDAGAGPPVVMIHGLGGTSNNFQTLVNDLGDYRVLRPDLPGAGRSPRRPGQPGLAALTGAVRDLLRATGVRRAHFIGHSMGTLICQYIAAETPAAVASLTLLGAIFEPPPAARQALKERAALARRDGMASIADAVASASVAQASRAEALVASAFARESLLRQDPEGYAAHCEALSEAVPADHAAIDCPCLLVAGEADPVAPVAMARQLQAAIADARLEIIPDIAHWHMVESPERVARLVVEHLALNPL